MTDFSAPQAPGAQGPQGLPPTPGQTPIQSLPKPAPITMPDPALMDPADTQRWFKLLDAQYNAIKQAMDAEFMASMAQQGQLLSFDEAQMQLAAQEDLAQETALFDAASMWSLSPQRVPEGKDAERQQAMTEWYESLRARSSDNPELLKQLEESFTKRQAIGSSLREDADQALDFVKRVIGQEGWLTEAGRGLLQGGSGMIPQDEGGYGTVMKRAQQQIRDLPTRRFGRTIPITGEEWLPGELKQKKQLGDFISQEDYSQLFREYTEPEIEKLLKKHAEELAPSYGKEFARGVGSIVGFFLGGPVKAIRGASIASKAMFGITKQALKAGTIGVGRRALAGAVEAGGAGGAFYLWTHAHGVLRPDQEALLADFEARKEKYGEEFAYRNIDKETLRKEMIQENAIQSALLGPIAVVTGAMGPWASNVLGKVPGIGALGRVAGKPTVAGMLSRTFGESIPFNFVAELGATAGEGLKQLRMDTDPEFLRMVQSRGLAYPDLKRPVIRIAKAVGERDWDQFVDALEDYAYELSPDIAGWAVIEGIRLFGSKIGAPPAKVRTALQAAVDVPDKIEREVKQRAAQRAVKEMGAASTATEQIVTQKGEEDALRSMQIEEHGYENTADMRSEAEKLRKAAAKVEDAEAASEMRDKAERLDIAAAELDAGTPEGRLRARIAIESESLDSMDLTVTPERVAAQRAMDAARLSGSAEAVAKKIQAGKGVRKTTKDPAEWVSGKSDRISLPDGATLQVHNLGDEWVPDIGVAVETEGFKTREEAITSAIELAREHGTITPETADNLLSHTPRREPVDAADSAALDAAEAASEGVWIAHQLKGETPTREQWGKTKDLSREDREFLRDMRDYKVEAASPEDLAKIRSEWAELQSKPASERGPARAEFLNKWRKSKDAQQVSKAAQPDADVLKPEGAQVSEGPVPTEAGGEGVRPSRQEGREEEVVRVKPRDELDAYQTPIGPPLPAGMKKRLSTKTPEEAARDSVAATAKKTADQISPVPDEKTLTVLVSSSLEDLHRRTIEGDAYAKEAFIERATIEMTKLARAFGQAGEDVVSEVLYDLWTTPEKWNPEKGQSFSSWAYTVLKNRVRDAHRKSKAKKRGGEVQTFSIDAATKGDEGDIYVEPEDYEGLDPSEIAAEKEFDIAESDVPDHVVADPAIDAIRAAMKELSPELRAVAEAIWVDGLSNSKTAEKIGVSKTTVARRKALAKEKLETITGQSLQAAVDMANRTGLSPGAGEAGAVAEALGQSKDMPKADPGESPPPRYNRGPFRSRPDELDAQRVSEIERRAAEELWNKGRKTGDELNEIHQKLAEEFDESYQSSASFTKQLRMFEQDYREMRSLLEAGQITDAAFSMWLDSMNEKFTGVFGAMLRYSENGSKTLNEIISYAEGPNYVDTGYATERPGQDMSILSGLPEEPPATVPKKKLPKVEETEAGGQASARSLIERAKKETDAQKKLDLAQSAIAAAHREMGESAPTWIRSSPSRSADPLRREAKKLGVKNLNRDWADIVTDMLDKVVEPGSESGRANVPALLGVAALATVGFTGDPVYIALAGMGLLTLTPAARKAYTRVFKAQKRATDRFLSGEHKAALPFIGYDLRMPDTYAPEIMKIAMRHEGKARTAVALAHRQMYTGSKSLFATVKGSQERLDQIGDALDNGPASPFWSSLDPAQQVIANELRGNFFQPWKDLVIDLHPYKKQLEHRIKTATADRQHFLQKAVSEARRAELARKAEEALGIDVRENAIDSLREELKNAKSKADKKSISDKIKKLKEEVKKLRDDNKVPSSRGIDFVTKKLDRQASSAQKQIVRDQAELEKFRGGWGIKEYFAHILSGSKERWNASFDIGQRKSPYLTERQNKKLLRQQERLRQQIAKHLKRRKNSSEAEFIRDPARVAFDYMKTMAWWAQHTVMRDEMERYLMGENRAMREMVNFNTGKKVEFMGGWYTHLGKLRMKKTKDGTSFEKMKGGKGGRPRVVLTNLGDQNNQVSLLAMSPQQIDAHIKGGRIVVIDSVAAQRLVRTFQGGALEKLAKGDPLEDAIWNYVQHISNDMALSQMGLSPADVVHRKVARWIAKSLQGLSSFAIMNALASPRNLMQIFAGATAYNALHGVMPATGVDNYVSATRYVRSHGRAAKLLRGRAAGPVKGPAGWELIDLHKFVADEAIPDSMIAAEENAAKRKDLQLEKEAVRLASANGVWIPSGLFFGVSETKGRKRGTSPFPSAGEKIADVTVKAPKHAFDFLMSNVEGVVRYNMYVRTYIESRKAGDSPLDADLKALAAVHNHHAYYSRISNPTWIMRNPWAQPFLMGLNKWPWMKFLHLTSAVSRGIREKDVGLLAWKTWEVGAAAGIAYLMWEVFGRDVGNVLGGRLQDWSVPGVAPELGGMLADTLQGEDESPDPIFTGVVTPGRAPMMQMAWDGMNALGEYALSGDPARARHLLERALRPIDPLVSSPVRMFHRAWGSEQVDDNVFAYRSPRSTLDMISGEENPVSYYVQNQGIVQFLYDQIPGMDRETVRQNLVYDKMWRDQKRKESRMRASNFSLQQSLGRMEGLPPDQQSQLFEQALEDFAGKRLELGSSMDDILRSATDTMKTVQSQKGYSWTLRALTRGSTHEKVKGLADLIEFTAGKKGALIPRAEVQRFLQEEILSGRYSPSTPVQRKAWERLVKVLSANYPE